MLLNELTDQQVAGAFIDQDAQQRRQDNAKNPTQLARERGQEYAQDKASPDPLKKRIAALRQQLAQLIMQDQKKTADAQKQQGAAPPPQGSQPPQGTV